jgi:hypothetical protein
MSDIKTLYGGDVQLKFSEGNHRYTVSTDGGKVWDIKKGVTTILGATLNKPALMLWPLNEAMKSLGARMVCTDQEKQIWEWTLDNDIVVNTIKIQAAATAHRKRSDKGKDVGHLAHSLVEDYLNAQLNSTSAGNTLTDDKQALAAFRAFKGWFEATQPKVLGVEQIVFSRENDVAGTFDCLLEIDGKVVLGDLKTTNASRDAPQGVYPEMFLQLGAYAQAYLEEKRAVFTYEAEGTKWDWQGFASYTSTTRADKKAGAILDDLAIINAGKTGDLNVVYASELGLSVQDCIDAWLRVLNTYKFLQPLSKQIKERGKK